MNPLRFLKNLFVDFLLKTTGTYVGAPPHPTGGNAARDAQEVRRVRFLSVQCGESDRTKRRPGVVAATATPCAEGSCPL